MPPPIMVSFVAGGAGPWKIDRIAAVVGETVPAADRLSIIEGPWKAHEGTWTLRGVTSNARYSVRNEVDTLAAVQEGLSRPAAKKAALIPIKKSEAWWNLAQDERRAIFEEQSAHIGIGMGFLPAVARRLHHSRELGEPFDFLTWFEYAPEHDDDFERMLSELRSTEEWRFVEREVDIRLSRE